MEETNGRNKFTVELPTQIRGHRISAQFNIQCISDLHLGPIQHNPSPENVWCTVDIGSTRLSVIVSSQ
jgi:hypothetical protein